MLIFNIQFNIPAAARKEVTYVYGIGTVPPAATAKTENASYSLLPGRYGLRTLK